jgi:NADPH-dependent 2,4-dienoyl-CoA reductase/sulfur reductase-like enzyme
MDRIVVVGGSVAAVNAVDGLRRHGYQGEIDLVSAETVLPYDRPPLSKEALREGHGHDQLLLREASWYDDHGVTLRLGAAAVALDPSNRMVTLAGGESVDYDGLVLATGCTARPVDALAGCSRFHEVRTLDEAAALHQDLRAGRHLVVIGAGFIGLEVAATASKMGLEVTVIEIAPLPLTRVLGDEAGRWFLDYHACHGVTIHCGAGIASIRETDRGVDIELADGTALFADVVVAGVGVVPALGWLEGSGIEVDNGVLCDPALRTSAPDVVAAGDIVRWHNPLFDETMRVEQWLNAVDQGDHAAATLLGADEPFAPVPYFWSDQFDAKVKFVGQAQAGCDVHLTEPHEGSLVALFRRGDLLGAALCINAPRQLALNKRAISHGVAWADAITT